jgi:Tol biopolymer transport system component
LLLLTTPYTPGTTGGFVSLYDMKANLLLESWEGLYLDGDTSKPQETIQEAAFSPDGSKIAIIGAFYVRVIDNSDRTVVVQFSTNARGGAVNASDERLDASIAWSPDGASLAWTINGNLSIYSHDGTITVLRDATTGSLPAPNRKIAWSPDGSRIAYESDGAIQFVDAVTGSLAGTLKISGSFVENHLRSISYSPDGSKLVLCTTEYVGVWTLSDQKLIFEQAITKPENEFDRFNDAVFSPDSASLAILQYGDKQILVYTLP